MGAKLFARYKAIEEYIWREQYWEANNLDAIRMEEYGIHFYDKSEEVFVK